MPLGEQLLDGTSLTQTGDALSLVIARPASLGELPTLVRPLIAEAASGSGLRWPGTISSSRVGHAQLS